MFYLNQIIERCSMIGKDFFLMIFTEDLSTDLKPDELGILKPFR